jgi:CheY-like chemotaxis protein
MMSDNPPKALHLLFVDDDSDESYLFNEALEHAGLNIQLSRAKDGNGLLEFLKSEPLPDIVFIDLNMPYKDGMEALIEIRKDNKFDKLPLVIYSTTQNSSHIDSSYKHGASLFVVKPNTFDGMVHIVKKVCTIDWENFSTPKREEFLIMAEQQ